MAFTIMVVIPLILFGVGFGISRVIKFSYVDLKKIVETLVETEKNQVLDDTVRQIDCYIASEGYQPFWRVQKYFQSSPKFCIANQFTYQNPDEERAKFVREHNEQCKDENDKWPSEDFVNYDEFILFHYKARAISDYQKILPQALEFVGMFDMEQLYYELPQFQPFFTSESYQTNVPFIKEVSVPVMNQLISEGKFRVIGSGEIYQNMRSNVSKNLEGEYTWSDDDFD